MFVVATNLATITGIRMMVEIMIFVIISNDQYPVAQSIVQNPTPSLLQFSLGCTPAHLHEPSNRIFRLRRLDRTRLEQSKSEDSTSA
jgi:hypothetical protein